MSGDESAFVARLTPGSDGGLGQEFARTLAQSPPADPSDPDSDWTSSDQTKSR